MNQPAIADAIKTLVDAAQDAQKALAPGETLVQKVEGFGNLVGDVVEDFKTVGDLGAELKSLQASDKTAQASLLEADLSHQDAHAKSEVDAALNVLGEAVNGALPNVKALIAAIENTPAPAAPETPAAT